MFFSALGEDEQKLRLERQPRIRLHSCAEPETGCPAFSISGHCTSYLLHSELEYSTHVL
jgi:hypothetical protein